MLLKNMEEEDESSRLGSDGGRAESQGRIKKKKYLNGWTWRDGVRGRDSAFSLFRSLIYLPFWVGRYAGRHCSVQGAAGKKA